MTSGWGHNENNAGKLMIRTRRLHIVSEPTKGLSMKVAFASTDKVHIDEHFGRAERFLIWDVGPDAASFSGMVEVKADGADEEDRIEARSSVLADCALVYVLQIGGPGGRAAGGEKDSSDQEQGAGADYRRR